ncbi:MAG: hypothetical protein MN733_22935 [Nitrososphaera sp.]|nr:hypothetical protein [Nitrososphaera sp.]
MPTRGIDPYTRPSTFGTTEQRLPSDYFPKGLNTFFKWNEIDVSQFDYWMVSGVTGADVHSTTISYIAAGTDECPGPRVRIRWIRSASSGGGAFTYVALLNRHGLPVVLPSRYVFEYRVVRNYLTGGGPGLPTPGPFIHNYDGSVPWGFGVCLSPTAGSIATNAHRLEGSSTTTSTAGGPALERPILSTPTAGTFYGSYYRITYDTTPATAGTPIYAVCGASAAFGDGAFGTARSTTTQDIQMGNPPVAGWTDRQDVKYAGFIFSLGSNIVDASVELADIRVLAHPMDTR